MLSIALYQPDIPQNTGTILRLAACFGVTVHIIEPCGFSFSSRLLKRAGLDYFERTKLQKHTDWKSFDAWNRSTNQRLLLFTTKGSVNYTKFTFNDNDILLMGRESAGVPDVVHERVDAKLVIPMAIGERSLNVAVATGMALGESLRQTKQFQE